MKSAKDLTKALSAQKGFGQLRNKLIFSRTLEYLQLWDCDSAHPVFEPCMRKCIIDRQKVRRKTQKRPSKLCNQFLAICNAVGQRNIRCQWYGLQRLAGDTWDLLPKEIRLEDGTVIDFPHFNVCDAKRNTCKALRVVRTLLKGETDAKERERTLDIKSKILRKRPAALKCLESKRKCPR